MRSATEGVDYTGWVTGTSENGFTHGTGPTLISVDASQINTPLAQGGVNTGDRVYVWGDLEVSDEGRSTLAAEGLVELVSSTAGNAPGESSTGANQ